MNRGQVLYRAAEMLDARSAEVGRLEGVERGEVAQSVEALLWYAGLTDKLAQLGGTVNPVAGPYFTFSMPEPTGVVGIVAPERPALLGLVAPLAAVLSGGSTAVALASPALPLPALVLGEVLATSDLPAGAANLLTGRHREMLPTLAAHRDVNAVEVSGCDEEERRKVEEAAADSVTRVVATEPDQRLSPHTALAFMEVKTVWHPVGR
jgi:acyl-CoA reductase-like NAD-dependent aldehyde dehydrogenase